MGGGSASREAPFEDHHMWRLLLARLHPDAGGDHELFLFAHALKEEACGYRCSESTPAWANGKRGTKPSAELFLRAWHEAMGCWASGNREALKRYLVSETPFVSVGD